MTTVGCEQALLAAQEQLAALGEAARSLVFAMNCNRMEGADGDPRYLREFMVLEDLLGAQKTSP